MSNRSVQIARARGWVPGTRLAGDEGRGETVIEIVALTQDHVIAKAISHRAQPTPDWGESTWDLTARTWRVVRVAPSGREGLADLLTTLTARATVVDGTVTLDAYSLADVLLASPWLAERDAVAIGAERHNISQAILRHVPETGPEVLPTPRRLALAEAYRRSAEIASAGGEQR